MTRREGYRLWHKRARRCQIFECPTLPLQIVWRRVDAPLVFKPAPPSYSQLPQVMQGVALISYPEVACDGKLGTEINFEIKGVYRFSTHGKIQYEEHDCKRPASFADFTADDYPHVKCIASCKIGDKMRIILQHSNRGVFSKEPRPK